MTRAGDSRSCGRTPDGWKFTERVYEVRYLDTTPLAGSAPRAAGGANQPKYLDMRTEVKHGRTA